MMKEKFQFYKNIILVVASALTLVAVTFAWFSTDKRNDVSSLQHVIGSELINVAFYEETTPNSYQKMSGDIELNEFVIGSHSKYKMAVTTYTDQPLSLTLAIDGLSSVSSNFKNAIEVKYSLYKANKNANGTFSETGSAIYQSENYVKLSELSSTGNIFTRVLNAYQSSSRDYFIIQYEIGISEDAPEEIEGMRSALGSVKVSAQLAAG